MKTFEWQFENDGYGIVGVSFKCPECGHNNRFVGDEYKPHTCAKCGAESMPDRDIEGQV